MVYGFKKPRKNSTSVRFAPKIVKPCNELTVKP